MDTFILPTLPGELHWEKPPLDWKIRSDNGLTIVAGENTDIFRDPSGKIPRDDAPAALFTPSDTSFILSARIMVNFNSDFDAGGILLYERDDLWAKLCFEYSPQKQPMVISVVTRGTSDDCSSVIIDGREVYLRVALTSHTIAFHYSLDGSYWHFVRFFSLGILKNLQVGFCAQAPAGKQCTAVFSEIRYQAKLLKERRSGE